jgi:hypothetical protein
MSTCTHEYFYVGGVTFTIHVEGATSPRQETYKCKKCGYVRKVEIPSQPYPTISDEDIDQLVAGVQGSQT